MKNQFQATEALQVRLPPFINRLTGEYVTGGTDTCTLTIKKPGGALVTPTASWDSDAKLWYYDVSIVDYLPGEWRVYAVSNAADTLPQWRVVTWGDYVEQLASLFKIGTGRWVVNATTNVLTLYDSDDVTPLYAFNLKGSDGLPNPHLVYERTPV